MFRVEGSSPSGSLGVQFRRLGLVCRILRGSLGLYKAYTMSGEVRGSGFMIIG